MRESKFFTIPKWVQLGRTIFGALFALTIASSVYLVAGVVFGFPWSGFFSSPRFQADTAIAGKVYAMTIFPALLLCIFLRNHIKFPNATLRVLVALILAWLIAVISSWNVVA